jgi:hypothetical protein
MATATLTATRSKTIRTSPRSMSAKHNASTPIGVDDPVGNVKSLYAPAARAFVRRDVTLTQTLLEAAFVTLSAHPPLLDKVDGPMANLRRKWDLLRITLETTVYTSSSPLTISATASTPDAPIPLKSLPSSLQAVLDLQPSQLVESLLSRSLKLWTPDTYHPSVLYLPVSIISALVFAALKVDCADAARRMIETWLAHRSEAASAPNMPGSHLVDLSPEGYEKILDIYCLQVLPRLGEWDYAMEFLKYEPELSLDKRKVCGVISVVGRHLLIDHCIVSKLIYTSLKTLHTQVMNPPVPAFRISSSTSSSSPSSGASSPHDQHDNHVDRTSSPASASSSSAATPRPSVSDDDHQEAPSRTSSSLSTSSLSSQSSQQTIRASQLPQHALTKHANGVGLKSSSARLRSRSPRHRGSSPEGGDGASLLSNANGGAATTTTTETRARSMTGSSSGTALPVTRPPLASPTDVFSPSASSSSGRGLATRPSVLDVLKEWFRPYTAESRAGRVIVPTVVVFVAVVLPLVAFIARLRMRRRLSSGATRLITHSTANTKPATGASAVRWLYKAVKDSVIMAGKGLV